MLYIYFVALLVVVLGLLLWPVRQHRAFCSVVVICFFVIGFALYGFAGSPQILPLLAEREVQLHDIKTSMQKNSEIIKSHPDNLAAWVAMGQDFLATGQWEAAVNAFKQAVVLSKGDPRLIMAYAKAQLLVTGGQVNDDIKKSLQMVVLQDPDNEEARYYLAVRELQAGNTKDAMKAMKALYESLPAGSPVKAMIDRQIGKTN